MSKYKSKSYNLISNQVRIIIISMNHFFLVYANIIHTYPEKQKNLINVF